MKESSAFCSKRMFYLLVLFFISPFVSLTAQERKVMNRPYIDERIWHYGFSVGLNYQDLNISNSGIPYINNGYAEYWYADVASYSPGFSVGVLGELKLNDYFSLRFIPTMHFGDKLVTFTEKSSMKKVEQTLKSTYIAVPIDLKISAPRYNNYCPYIVTGLVPTFDMTVKKGKELLVNRTDCMFEIGMGMDLYYPFFKLIPELKFCFGLSDILVRKRTDLTDLTVFKYNNSLQSAQNRMIVFTLYFE